MPLYEYWCQACGKEIDKILPADQRDKIVSCPACGAKMTRKVGKIAHFEFKGILA